MNTIGIQILYAILRHYRLNLPDVVKDGRREQKIARARGMLCYMLRKHSRMTFKEIGDNLDLHYSTVIHHNKEISTAIDPGIIAEREQVEKIYQAVVVAEYDAAIPF